jgi:hypothetical protein
VLLDDCLSYAWPVRTEVYLGFLWRNADKFATGFEVVRARCNQEIVTWEQTKMMVMFLRCLRFVFDGHQLQREPALWWSQREYSNDGQVQVWHGLGFQNTLQRYGYCWLEPRIDWSQLTFHTNITDNVLFGNRPIRSRYLRRGGQVYDFIALTRLLELGLGWIGRYMDNIAIQSQLISWIAHLCLKQLRIDVLTTVKREIKLEYREESLEGQRPFSFKYLNKIMIGGVHLISGNRSRFKRVTRLSRFLFGYSDGNFRNNWEDRPFRKLYRRAHTALGLLRPDLATTLWQQLERHLHAYHWVLPYPSSYDGFMHKTKQSQRMWYSIHLVSGSGDADDLCNVWEWARKRRQGGEPAVLPGYLTWTKEEWQEWIGAEVVASSSRV